MKKFFVVLISILVIVIAGLIVLATVDFNRAAKEHLYVQVAGAGKEETFTSSDGVVYNTYWYTLPALNEQAKTVEVTFSANKQLKEGAYLKIYVKNGNEVTSYDEVSVSEIPEQVKQQLLK